MTLISEGCTLIAWKRSDLLRVLRQQPQIKNIFNSIIGQDVALKLFKSNKVIDSTGGADGVRNGILENVMYGGPAKPTGNY